MYPADGADPCFFRVNDDEYEPSGICPIRGAGGAVTGLRCDRLVEMVRADHVAPWA
jgi:hypothetical protein